MRKIEVAGAALLAVLAAGTLSPSQAQQASAQQPSHASYLEKVTPENAVLVYVDFNTGLDNLLTTVPGPVLRNNVAAYTKLNRIFEMPTAIFGEEDDRYYGPFYPEVKENVTHDSHRFHRTTPSGYTPEFADWLAATGRKNVIIGGMSIDNCTMHTTLDLLRDGYNVFVVLDVSSTNNKLAEDAAVLRMTNAGAVPTTWLSVATELVGDWDSPNGHELMQVVQEHLKGSTVGEPQDTTPDGLGLGEG